jgi:hypothetical protein
MSGAIIPHGSQMGHHRKLDLAIKELSGNSIVQTNICPWQAFKMAKKLHGQDVGDPKSG